MKAAGVSTVFQCWYFGNYPGIMNKAAGELSFSDFTEDENAFLERLARPDWGNDAPRVAQLWRRLSDAYAEYPLSNDMQYYGPFHAGVAWPLHAYAEMKPLGRTWKPLDAPSGDVIGEALENHTLDEAMILSGRMAEGAAARLPDGTGEYSALAAKYRGNRARELDAGVMQALALQFESANGIFRFYRDRSEAIDLSRNRKDAQGARKALARMRRTVLREKEIAAAMRALSAADSRLGFHSEAECHQYFPEKFDWRIGELDKTLADIADIDAALGRGEPYPESAFEKNAPRCTIGGGWTAAEGFRFRLEENETGDLTVHVETEARSVAVATFDAAGVQWQKRASIDCAGKTQSALAWNAITPGHAAKGGAKRQDGKWTYSLTLCAEGWNRDTRLRPEWIEISAGGKRWPGLPQPEARLNLGYLQPAICGRIVR